MKYTRWVLAIVVILGFTSCSDAIFNEHQDVREVMAWAKDDVKTFTVPVPDTQAYDVKIALRHHSSTQGPTILVKADITDPDGETSSKNIPVHIRDEHGQLTGEVAVDITDTEYPLMADYKFPKAGTYTFKLSHLEDGDMLAGLMEVGLVIVPVKKEEE